MTAVAGNLAGQLSRAQYWFAAADVIWSCLCVRTLAPWQRVVQLTKHVTACRTGRCHATTGHQRHQLMIANCRAGVVAPSIMVMASAQGLARELWLLL
jgi:hypothetical protein